MSACADTHNAASAGCGVGKGGGQMRSTLWRVYLYLVASAALVFVTFAIQQFIGAVLELELVLPTHSYALDPFPSMQRAVALLAIALVVVAPVGGLHWELIRREQRTQPSARSTGMRAYCFGVLFLIYIVFGIGLGVAFVQNLTEPLAPGAVKLVPFNVVALATLIADLLGLVALLVLFRWTRPLQRVPARQRTGA